MGIAAEILAIRLTLACWVLESAFCGVHGASEHVGILGKSLQLKVIQRIVVVFVVFGSGSDAWGGLWCLSVRLFPEVPAGRVCTLRCFLPTEHLNLVHCC